VKEGSRIVKLSVSIVLAVTSPLLLLLSNLYFVATPAFIRFEYGRPSFPRSGLYSDADRLALAEATLHYMRSNEGEDYLTSLQVRGWAVYNAREIKHLVDARRVFRAALFVHVLCMVLCALALVLARRRGVAWPGVIGALGAGCLVFVALLAGIGLLAYTNFGLFFTIFHRLLFEGESWLFAFSDTLIQLFPVQFWMDATWLLAALTMGECILVAVISLVLPRRAEARR
jgi:integral membrane protein (TIGR01906 family)